MIAKRYVVAIALGACLLGLSAPGSQKDPVARPFKGYMEARGVFTLGPDGAPVDYEAWGGGNFTHLGRTTLHAVGYPTESGEFVIEVAMIAANGDQLFYEGVYDPVNPPTGEIPWTGGSGRFEGATGSHTEDVEAVFTFDPVQGTLTVDVAAYFEGTLIY